MGIPVMGTELTEVHEEEFSQKKIKSMLFAPLTKFLQCFSWFNYFFFIHELISSRDYGNLRCLLFLSTFQSGMYYTHILDTKTILYDQYLFHFVLFLFFIIIN